MKNIKNKATALLGVVTALCLMIGTLAVYTDRFQSRTEYTAGTLDIVLTENWTADNAILADTYKPGTALKFNYSLANNGNLAASIRESIVLSFEKQISTGGDREFDLYPASAVTVDAKGNVTAITGTALSPVYGTGTKDGKTVYTLTYTPDYFTLNGTGSDGQSVANGKNGYSCCYYLVFNVDVDNSFQNVNLGLEYLAQALQYNNTGDETWENYTYVVTQNFNIGGTDIKVVPQLP